VRAAQRSAESAMRAQDQLIVRLDAKRKALKKQVKPLKKLVDQRRREVSVLKGIIKTRQERLAEKEAQYADPSSAPENAAEILKRLRADLAKAERTHAANVKRQQAAIRAVWGKKTQIANIKNQRKATVARREGAEASLSVYIKQMAELARLKVEAQATVGLAEGGTFSWPTTGRISQPYGCTGVVYNPKRGSCKHFHDGIDVVDGYGTPVRTIAAGVVSYAGWNPYDQEGRAYVVDVVHTDGYVSRYGHLIAGDKVKAGDLVHTGEIIGRMGSTGKSTGTHLHFEVLLNGKDIDPMSVLPAGVVKVDKASTKAGKAQLVRAAKQAARAKKPKPTPLPPPAEPFPYAKEAPVATCADTGDKVSAGGPKPDE
jgi:murein DD-endopeptidase MepM/ murein hydrolase activator NlpD